MNVMVTRYREAREDGVEEESDGEYVKAEDYDKMERLFRYWIGEAGCVHLMERELQAVGLEGDSAQC